MGHSPLPFLRQLMLLCLLVLPVHGYSSAKPTSSEVASELKHFKEMSKQQLHRARDLLQRDIQAQGQRLDAQDKRFDDHGKRLDGQDERLNAQDQRLSSMDSHIDLWIGGFGLLATLLGLAIPLTAFFSVKNRAIAEASKAASETARSEVAGWLNGKRVELELEIEALRSRVKELQKEADTHAQTFQRDLNKTRTELETQAKELLEKDLQNSDRANLPKKVVLSAEQQESLVAVAKEALEKPESQYQASDWDNRAFAALAAEDNHEAIRCWTKVAQMSTAPKDIQVQALFNKGVILYRIGDHKAALTAHTDLIQRFINDSGETIRGLVAKAMLNKGVILGQQNQPEAALAAYDELVRRFDNDPTETIREQVAKAMLNKGVKLGEQSNPEAELATYDELIQRFGNDTADGLREQVAKAMLNKGNALSRLKLFEAAPVEAAPATYDELIQRFGNDIAENIRQTVADAHIGKGFTLLCQAKQRWADEAKRTADLRQAQQLFFKALTGCSDENRDIVLGNQSYCAHLLGEPLEIVRPTLKQALELSGEALYKATLEDLAIHPVPDKDDPFRALLEAVWREVQAEKSQ